LNVNAYPDCWRNTFLLIEEITNGLGTRLTSILSALKL